MKLHWKMEIQLTCTKRVYNDYLTRTNSGFTNSKEIYNWKEQ